MRRSLRRPAVLTAAAVAASLGAALAAGPCGRKTVVLAGDGGFAMNMTELWTATQERADICVIIMNDGIYAAIDSRTNTIVWQYGKYRIKGTGAGYLNNPDGLDVLPPNSLLNAN